MEEIGKFIKIWLGPVKKKCTPKLYIVGGAVRDCILRRKISDIDIVCKNAKKAANIIGRDKNRAVVFFGKKAKAFCYRIVDKNDSSLFIDIAEMSGNTISDDLKCRDFTINAMAVSVDFNANSYEILDPLNGKQDIEDKIIRVCRSDAFISDPLRILRAFRFASETGFSIDIETKKLAAENVDLITSVSYERITSELFKILNTKNCAKNINELNRMGIWETIFYRELFFEKERLIVKQDSCAEKKSTEILKNCENIINNLYLLFYPWHKNIKKILLEGNNLPLLKLTALLYDLRKNHKSSFLFLKDDMQVFQIDLKIGKLMKLSRRDLGFLKVLINGRCEVKSLFISENNTKNLIKFSGKFKNTMVCLIIIEIAEIIAKTDLDFCLEHLQKNREINLLTEYVKKYFNEIRAVVNKESIITGRDLIRIGIKPGFHMGTILKKMRELQDFGIITDKAEAVNFVRENEKKYLWGNS